MFHRCLTLSEKSSNAVKQRAIEPTNILKCMHPTKKTNKIIPRNFSMSIQSLWQTRSCKIIEHNDESGYALFLQRTQTVNQHPIPSCNIHNGRSWYLILVIFPLQLIFSKLQLFKQLFEPLMLSKLIFQLEVLGLQELFFLYLSLQVQL